MSGKLGMEAKLFYKRGGVAAAGDWVEATNVRDNTLNLGKASADLSTRGNNGWRAKKGGLKEASVEFEMVWDPDDEAFDAMQDSYIGNNIIGLAVMDGPMATGTGLVADFEVMKFNRNEPLEEAVTAQVSAEPAYSGTAPEWYENGSTGTGSA